MSWICSRNFVHLSISQGIQLNMVSQTKLVLLLVIILYIVEGHSRDSLSRYFAVLHLLSAGLIGRKQTLAKGALEEKG